MRAPLMRQQRRRGQEQWRRGQQSSQHTNTSPCTPAPPPPGAHAGNTISEGGFAPNRVSAASLLDIGSSTDKKGKKYYDYEFLVRTGERAALAGGGGTGAQLTGQRRAPARRGRLAPGVWRSTTRAAGLACGWLPATPLSPSPPSLCELALLC